MPKDESKQNGRDIHTSYKGTFKEGTLMIEGSVASAMITVGDGKNAVEKLVKGYNDHVETLKNAAKEAAGETTILRGKLLGGKDNLHLAVYGTGPEHITGVVKNPKDNFDTCEKDKKSPWMDLYVGVEKGEHSMWRSVAFHGDEALALKGKVSEGDRIELDARPSQKKVGDEWRPIYVPEGPVKIHPAADADKKVDDSPEP